MESAMSMRKYTSQQIRPLLIKSLDETFHPQTVPAYYATEMFSSLRDKFPDFTYKEATLNPSNPRDKATDWESDIVEHFRNHPESTEKFGERPAATGPMLFVARPIKVTDRACLQCHGEAKDLPKTVLAKYGNQQGLGWEMNEVVGAQIAAVPTQVATQRAEKQFQTILGILIGVFLVVLIALNILLNKFVIAPVKKIAAMMDAASTNPEATDDLETSGSDEISTLSSSFNRMNRSLKKAIELIDE